jgi:hypothetical protein
MLATIAALDEGLMREPSTLAQLKDVMAVIDRVRSSGAAMELQYVDLEERFRFCPSLCPSMYLSVCFFWRP